ncbi:MAG TPA: alpha-L-fucosidase [Terracidiphilus sp.]|nr:alpha-L-fucosidase [Terracidiphilus sp.]
MNRRDLLKSLALPAAGAIANSVAAPLFAADPAAGPATELTPALTRYQRLRFGCSFHFSTPTFTGDDYDVGNKPATVYDPTHLDVRQWIRVAHEMGAKYAVLTAKYMSGFCLWDSKGYDYTVAQSRNKTDVVAAFVAACREFGLQPGFYYCILDPHNEGKFDWDAPISDKYFDLIRHHVTELHTTYPNTFYQLFDITWKLNPEQRWELYRLVKSHSPDCIIVDNQGFKQSRANQGRLCESASWPTDVINGEDTLPPLEGHDPHVVYEKKTYYMPFETWLPTGPPYPPMPWMHTWFWHPWYKPQKPEVIAESYRICMEHNANLLLNLAPDQAGQIPANQVETFHRVAELIHNPKC